MLKLEIEYRDDPKLLAFYKVKLLEPGWAGELSDNEAEYIASELSKSPKLRGIWRKTLMEAGYAGRRRKKPSPYVVKLWNDFLCSHAVCDSKGICTHGNN